MGTNFYNGTDAELYTGGLAFADKINATPTVFGLTSAQAGAFTGVYQAYGSAYQVATDPETRTRGNTAAKNLTRAALKKMCADYASIINGISTVTDQQKIELGLNVRKKPSPRPAPDTRPSLTVVSVEGRTITLGLRNADKAKRAKPATAMYANVYTYVSTGGETAPADPTLWQFDGPATKSNYTLTVPDDVPAGSVLSVTAVWVSRRGDMSPIAMPITTHVQYGPATPVAGKMKIAA